jgi:uncharacterized BrkB/YihY/UPF0761 family membrane protein
MPRDLRSTDGGPIALPFHERGRARKRGRWLSRRMMLSVVVAVLLFGTGLTVTVKAAETQALTPDVMGFAILQISLLVLLIVVGAVGLLLLRPTTPFEGRERDR